MTYVWLPRKVCFCSFICFEVSANFCVALCDGCQSDSSKPAVTRWCLRLGEPFITAWQKWFGYWIQQTHGPYNDTKKKNKLCLNFLLNRYPEEFLIRLWLWCLKLILFPLRPWYPHILTMKITKYKPSRRTLSLKNLWRVIYEEDIYGLNHKPPRIWQVDNYNRLPPFLLFGAVGPKKKNTYESLYSCTNLRETFESFLFVTFLGIVSVSVRP